MGGARAVLDRAREDFARGEYRWVAQVASQLVFADPGNAEARALNADALEQLGYQSESATARNAYLQGALELRNGIRGLQGVSTAAPDVVRALPLELFFDFMAVRLAAEKTLGKSITLNWQFSDTKQQLVLRLRNGTLSTSMDLQDPAADATVVLTRAVLDEIALQRTTFPAALSAGRIAANPAPARLLELLSAIETFPQLFPLVEPRPERK
jgi:alkyl sulfatase BDS1-like metallo-beta-lactamase superfamily hydrolase